MSRKLSTGYQVFRVFNVIFLAAMALLCVLPFINVLAISFSAKHAANAGLVGLWPVDFTLESYSKTLGNKSFIQSIVVSLLRTSLGTVIQLVLIFLAAYPLSFDDKSFRFRTAISWFFVVTMLFGAGLIPWFLNINSMHLTNTIWALVLPGAVPVFSLVLLINFFRRVPVELREAALIDGAGHVKTLTQIYLPVSMAAFATFGLLAVVEHWNSWFDGMLFMSDYRQYPLASFLQTVVQTLDFTKMNLKPEDLENVSTRTLRAAQVFIACVPVLMMYPFLQKYFVKGMTLGSVKE